MGIQPWDPTALPAQRRLDEFEKLGWKKIDPGYIRRGIAMPFGAAPGGVFLEPNRIRKARYRWMWP